MKPSFRLCPSIGGFYTPRSAGTVISKDKETKIIGGKEYVFEIALHANVAFIRAWKADTAMMILCGMPTYYYTAAIVLKFPVTPVGNLHQTQL